MHAHQADLVELLHGGSDGLGLLLRARLGPQIHNHVHGVVAEDARAGIADDLASWDVWDSIREEAEDCLGDPGAVDVDSVEHHEDAPELLILLNVMLGKEVNFLRIFQNFVIANERHLQRWAFVQRQIGPIPRPEASDSQCPPLDGQQDTS